MFAIVRKAAGRRATFYSYDLFARVNATPPDNFSCKVRFGRTGDAAGQSALWVIGMDMHIENIESTQHPLNGRRMFAVMTALGLALLSSGCANDNIRVHTEQFHSTTQVPALSLTAQDLHGAGVALITPSSITGQEEDRQALALAFAEKLRIARPDLRCVTLPETLSAVNRAGLGPEYKRMFEDSRLTGIFDRETLRKVAGVTGVRYLAQLKLGGFRQESKARWGTFGMRVLETKSAAIRLFLQVWDSQDGAVVWEGSQEMTLAFESLAEEAVPLRRAVEASAGELVMRLPPALLAASEPKDPKSDAAKGNAQVLGSNLGRHGD